MRIPGRTILMAGGTSGIGLALAHLLAAHGIAVAGVDVIAGRLIEVNVTCPGGMHKTDALLGTDLSGAIVRRLLAPPAATVAPVCPPAYKELCL